ncbi:MAG: hypothetical protein IPJ13_10365 [Saprospiraceae bacterium]|nr:hypothetical protein [Saprospiraceae bacterium]
MRIPCKTIIGTAAEGNKYFQRKRIESLILRALRKGNFVHFTAPRRTGKTSILKELANETYEDLACIYQDIESDKTSADLYKRLIKLIGSLSINPQIGAKKSGQRSHPKKSKELKF